MDLAFRDESPNYKEKFTSNSYKLNIIDICLRQVLKFTVIQKKNLSFNIHVTFIIYLLTYVLIHNKTYQAESFQLRLFFELMMLITFKFVIKVKYN